MNRWLKITIIATIVFAGINANGAVDVNALNQSLEKIKTADFGQGRGDFDKITEIIRQVNADELKQIEKQLDDFLKTDATYTSRQFVCEQLSMTGSEASVPVLKPMLLDANTCDMARYALERIPGEAVDKALREAIDKADVTLKAGIINTIGVRGDKKAVALLVKLITDTNQAVANAAVSALGKIDDPCAVAAIAKAKGEIKGALQPAVLEAYLLCADRLAAKGQKGNASAIYKQLSAPAEPIQIRTAAMRGMIMASGDKAGDLIVEIFKSNDKQMQTAAIATLKNVADTNVIKMAAEQLPNLAAEQQIQLLAALAECNNHAALPAILSAAKSSDDNVRVAALNAIGILGDTSTIDTLAQTASTASGPEQKAAQDALYRLRGADVDQAILKKMPGAEPKAKVELIRSCDQRNITAAAPLLIKAAKDANEPVRIEAIRALRNLADESNLQKLIDLQMGASEAERAELEKTVIAVAKLIPADKSPAGKILASVSSAKDLDTRCSLLSVLGKIGDPAALPVLRDALGDKEDKVKDAAVRSLSDWPTPEPIADLLNVAKESQNPTHKALALRGYIRLTGLDSNRPAEETIKMYRGAMALSPTPSEKKMVLSGLANMKSPEAIKMAGEYLGNDELKAEAETAIVKIAFWTMRNEPQQTRDLLEKVIAGTTNETVRRQAQNLLQRGR
ncbi:MAG: HEAT repeat domain-containing protein [Sedimentisphaerales bacterium]